MFSALEIFLGMRYINLLFTYYFYFLLKETNRWRGHRSLLGRSTLIFQPHKDVATLYRAVYKYKATGFHNFKTSPNILTDLHNSFTGTLDNRIARKDD